METVKLLLALLLLIIAFGCWIVILIEAFKDDVWKGIAYLLCGFYALYYALLEFDHEHKWWIVLGMVSGGTVAGLLVPSLR